MSNELVKWENAKNAISECKNIDEITKIIDKSKIMQAYVKQAKESLQVQNDVAEIKLRAERKAGELLKIMNIPKHNEKNELQEVTRLSDLGVEKHESYRWQQIANIPEDKFDNRILEIKEKNKEITENEILNFAKSLKKENTIINNEIKEIKISEYGENIFFESGEYGIDRWDDYIIKDNDNWPTITTLSRFFHDDMTEYSLREYARVQTFPDYFKFCGNYSTIKKQIGNAVAPQMGKYISEKLKGKTYGDLFSGCGGFSMGLKMNNKKGLWAVEWNKDAAKTYKINFKDHFMSNENIKFINPKDLNKVDIIIGGPPCQGFSFAGLRFKDDPRNELYKEFLRFVEVLKPKEFIMENVAQIYEIKDQIINDFKSIKYNVEIEIVEGENIEMRQNRKRCFFKGVLNG